MSTSPPVSSTPAMGSADKGFFGHPRALAHIFGVEMWERFSFYGMQGIRQRLDSFACAPS